MKALIFQSKVVDLAEQEFEAHESMSWVDAEDGVAIGWGFDGASFTAPTAAVLTYANQRTKEYPQIGDQLDALFHAGVFPPEMAAQIQAVKDKYPKGTP